MSPETPNDSLESMNQKEVIPDSYTVPDSPELQKLLDLTNQLNQKIETRRKEAPYLWPTIQEKLQVSWTYNSNAIEGNTLTYGETLFLVQEGITAKGKPLKDHIEAKNHHEAIYILLDIVKDNRAISESFIKELNAILLQGVKSTPAVNQHGDRVNKPATPGQYKKLPNHVLLPQGGMHRYVDPLQVQPQMEQLCQWINDHLEAINPVLVAAMAHYNLVRIHPFDDGNGRGVRILMNLILMKKGFPPAVIRNENRPDYIGALNQANEGNLAPFVEFITQSLIETQEVMVEDFNKEEKKKGKE